VLLCSVSVSECSWEVIQLKASGRFVGLVYAEDEERALVRCLANLGQSNTSFAGHRNDVHSLGLCRHRQSICYFFRRALTAIPSNDAYS